MQLGLEASLLHCMLRAALLASFSVGFGSEIGAGDPKRHKASYQNDRHMHVPLAGRDSFTTGNFCQISTPLHMMACKCTPSDRNCPDGRTHPHAHGQQPEQHMNAQTWKRNPPRRQAQYGCSTISRVIVLST